MASFLEGSLARDLARGFKGQLKTGTLRRTVSPDTVSQDDYGDIQPDTAVESSFTGMTTTGSAQYRAAWQIPDTDVVIYILLASLEPATRPQQDDLIKISSIWYKVRKVLGSDPADAGMNLQAYTITDPDASA